MDQPLNLVESKVNYGFNCFLDELGYQYYRVNTGLVLSLLVFRVDTVISNCLSEFFWQ